MVFADYLGIYGNTVVLDHGLGVFSLYGHLSTHRRAAGPDRCRRARSLGQTGETGLAGGDHLHFSIMLRGVHVDPVEWWDPQWMRDHLSDQLASLPAAKPAAATASAPQPAPAPAQRRRRSGGAWRKPSPDRASRPASACSPSGTCPPTPTSRR